MSGEVSETAAMRPDDNTGSDVPGSAEGIPPAEDTGHVQHGEPKSYDPDEPSDQPHGE